MRVATAVSLVLATLLGCSGKRIPGTEIEDNRDTRAILDVMEKYRKAVEAKNAGDLKALVAPTFKDDGGSAGVDDDLTYETLESRLPERFAKISDVQLDLTVKKITVNPDDTAVAVYNYVSRYKVSGTISDRPTTDSEIKQMTFQKIGPEWKIVSGI